MLDLSHLPEPTGELATFGLMAEEAFGDRGAEAIKAAPYAQYDNDPVGFCHDVLHITPWGRYAGMDPAHASQVDFLEAVRDHDQTAWRTGHKLSKSTSDAILAIWWTLCIPRGRVTISAPSSDQIEDIIWPEIRLLYEGRHPGQGPAAKSLNIGRLYKNADNGLEITDGWGIIGVSTDKPERMAGRSGSRQLVIIDEASGYDEQILEAVFGNMAGGGKVVLTGNPTQVVGTFYDAFNTKRAAWKLLHTPSTASPNFFPGAAPHVEGLATPKWLKLRTEDWGGPGNPIYDVRVLGEYPTRGEMCVVSLALVEAARARWKTTPEEGRLELGVDPSRGGGDEAIVAWRRGLRVAGLRALPVDAKDTRMPPGHQVGARVAQLARELHELKPGAMEPRIKVDAIGIGSSVVDYLWANHRDEFEIVAVNSSESASEWIEVRPGRTAKDEYDNLRAQVGFGVADFLRSGGALPDDGKLHADLVAAKYRLTQRGKQAIEPKDDIKKRLGRSPDRGDAVGLAIYEPATFDEEEDWGVTRVKTMKNRRR